MKVVVDANIFISAIINQKGRIHEVFAISRNKRKFFTPSILLEEIRRHKTKIISYTYLTVGEFDEILNFLLSRIKVIEDSSIPVELRRKALLLLKNIDEEDATYIALTMYLNAKLWTGDKKLISGLKKKNFDSFISVNELLNLIS